MPVAEWASDDEGESADLFADDILDVAEAECFERQSLEFERQIAIRDLRTLIQQLPPGNTIGALKSTNGIRTTSSSARREARALWHPISTSPTKPNPPPSSKSWIVTDGAVRRVAKNTMPRSQWLVCAIETRPDRAADQHIDTRGCAATGRRSTLQKQYASASSATSQCNKRRLASEELDVM